ncbi:N-acetylglucosamine-6-phosphate deacetylase [Eubacteriales bacterium OttesenSCG-928-M02]|nr:N-acetylglucosamine-6-phosphate deacetylase [Eubacteriales bacterium OttesenSCG-928-M02]
MRIKSQRVWIEEAFIPAVIEIEGDSIQAIFPGDGAADVDYGSHRILPGFIDSHTHGYGGGDASDGNPDTIREWIPYYPKEGVTTFLPGTVTRSEDRILKAMKAIKEVDEEGIKGANLYGIFLQGPYTSHDFLGAYDPYLVQKPDVEQFKMFQDACGGRIKMIGLAVEKDDGHRVLKHCVENNIIVSMGHSGVLYEEAAQAVQEGASNITHCFNNMIPLHHREPGLPGAALTIRELYCEVIADGIHIHPAIMNLIGTMKGKDKLIVITDSSRYKGLAPGYYESVDRKVTIGEDGVGRLPNGKLAGSCITMPQSVKNLMEMANLPEATAINAGTINPARMLGIGDVKGLLAPGYHADIAVLDDDYLSVQTYVMGTPML